MIFALSLHAEIYESYEEFLSIEPAGGIVMAADPGAASGLIRIQAVGICLPAIVYGYQPLTREVVEAMNLGAVNYLDWPFTAEGLGPALERAHTVGRQRMIGLQTKRVARELVGRLSPREQQVLSCIVAGQRNKDIAQTLQISPRTVEIHRGNMMTKLNVETAAEAIKIAIRADLEDEADKAGKAYGSVVRRRDVR